MTSRAASSVMTKCPHRSRYRRLRLGVSHRAAEVLANIRIGNQPDDWPLIARNRATQQKPRSNDWLRQPAVLLILRHRRAILNGWESVCTIENVMRAGSRGKRGLLAPS